MDPIYGYQAVNVEAQSRDPSSLLNWTRRILAVRRQFRCFGRGTLEFLRPRNRKIIAYVRKLDDEVVLCVANLSQTAQAVELELAEYKGLVPVELMGRNSFPPIGDLPYFLTLPAHGFFWLLLSATAPPPAWHVERLPATELPVLVLVDELATLLPDNPKAATSPVIRHTLQALEQEVLPTFLGARDWCPHSKQAIISARLGDRTLWRHEQRSYVLSVVEVQTNVGLQKYFLPLAVAWEDGPDTGVLRTAEWTLAKVRQHARTGVLIDAFADPAFCASVVRCAASNVTVPFAAGQLHFERGDAPDLLGSGEFENVHVVGSDMATTSVVLDDTILLKAYRRVEPGPNPDIEMTRFLARKGFPSVPAHVGHVAYSGGQRTEVIALFENVRTQGDAWTYTLNHLERFLADVAADGEQPSAPHALFNAQMHKLGVRIGQMHALLASPESDPAFMPEPVIEADLVRWAGRANARLGEVLQSLSERLLQLPESARPLAESILAMRGQIFDRIIELSNTSTGWLKTRYHGDLHLGKVLLAADDFYITGFEGDPSRPVAALRRKDAPLRDVAILLNSLCYVRLVGLERAVVARPEQRERLERAVQEWLASAANALMAGYAEGIGDARCVPAREEERMRLVRLFRISRALYEADSELDERLSWTGVPLQVLLEQVEAT